MSPGFDDGREGDEHQGLSSAAGTILYQLYDLFSHKVSDSLFCLLSIVVLELVICVVLLSILFTQSSGAPSYVVSLIFFQHLYYDASVLSTSSRLSLLSVCQSILD